MMKTEKPPAPSGNQPFAPIRRDALRLAWLLSPLTPMERAPERPSAGQTPARSASAADERLQPVAQPRPDFPSSLVQRLRRGTVRVQFNVLPDGSVGAAEVVDSSHARLNPAALVAVAQWRFQPVARAQAARVELALKLD